MSIIFENVDGTIGVVIPSPNWKGTIEDLAIKDVPEGLSYQIVEDSTIPSDRTFRAAWRKGNNAVDVDMPKAREIHMNNIRMSRDERLKELDKRKYGNEFDAERETLRGIPQNFDLASANTPDELKALWPDI